MTSLCVAAALTVQAAGDGSTAYNFLNLPASSHVYGLGGVNTSLIDYDIASIEQNPALLGPELSNQLSLSYMRYIGDCNFASATYGHSAGEHGAWAASIRYFGYGEMKAADETGAITGTFSPRDISVSATYSHDINDCLRGGISIKAIHSSYEIYSATAIAADLGVNYYDIESDLSLSAVVTNLGGQVKRFNDHSDKLPVDIRLGMTKGLGETPFRLSLTAWHLPKWHLPYTDPGDGSGQTEEKVKDTFATNLMRHLVIGLEYLPSDNFYAGIGYNYKTRTDMSTYKRSFLSGFSACAGFNVSRFSIGAAIASPHNGAMTFMLNITASLSSLTQ